MPALILTPIQQVNLFLHLSMDYPDSVGFNSILWKRGYRVFLIGQSLPVPPSVRQRVEQSLQVQCNTIVVPDIIYKHISSNHILLLECKSSVFEFDPDDRHTRQACGYLCLTPDHIFQQLAQLPTGSASASLLYATCNDGYEDLAVVLSEISAGIQGSMDAATLNFEVGGLELKSDGLYLLEIVNGAKTATKIASDVSVIRSLYLIPVDPDVNLYDEYGQKVLEQYVQNSLRTMIGRLVGLAEFKFTINDVCKEAIPVWDVWMQKSKRRLRAFVRDYVDQVVSNLLSKGLSIVYDQGVYSVPKVSLSVAERVRGYLRSPGFGRLSNESINMLEQDVLEEVLDTSVEPHEDD